MLSTSLMLFNVYVLCIGNRLKKTYFGHMAEIGTCSSLEQSKDCAGNGGSDTAGINGYHNNGNQERDLIPEKSSPGRMSEASEKYMQSLLLERSKLENGFPLAVKLIDDALERIQLNGRVPTRDQYADIYQQRTIKLSQKVHVPIKDKKFNYVGKLLGPKGNSLKRLQEETQCKIVILGRFSMKDRNREEELRNSANAKYAHLNLPLHVEVSTIAPPAEAYARIAYALAELRRYLIPDKHDDIRQEQFRELMEDPEAAKKITLKQQQQQQLHSGQTFSNNNFHRSNNGNYRPKYQQQAQNYHNDETVYYRTHSTFHPGNQRINSMQAGIAPQPLPPTMVSATTCAATTNYNGYSANNYLTTPAAVGNVAVVTGTTVPSVPSLNMRYRPTQLPYHFVKK